MKALINNIVSFPEKRKDDILFFLRLSTGVIFAQAGFGKFENFERTVGFFSSIGIPFAELNTILAAGSELIGGLLLIVGLFTRFAVIPMAFTMLVALLTAHADVLTSPSALFSEAAFNYLLIFLLLGATGAGKWSFDNKFNK